MMAPRGNNHRLPGRLPLYWITGLACAALAWQTAQAAHPVAVPAESAAALAYHATSNRLWIAGQILSLTFPLLLLLTTWGSRLHSRLVRLCGGRRYLSLALFAGGYFLVAKLLWLPVFHLWLLARDKATGAAGRTFAEYALGQAPGLILSVAGMIALTLLGYWLIARSPRRWWLWATVVLTGVASVVLLVEPYTQRLAPLGDSAIEVEIRALAARAGIPASAIVTKHCQPAYSCPPGRVIGLGPTRRLILDDALLERTPQRQLLQVVAHEAKHFARDDNIKAVFITAGLLLIGFLGTDRIGRWSVARWSRRFGFYSLAHPASLPLAALLLTAIYLLTLPAVSVVRQKVEHEADRFGLELNRDNEALALIMVEDAKHSPHRVIDDSLLFRLTRATHPSIGERIRFANTYRPWLEGAESVHGND